MESPPPSSTTSDESGHPQIPHALRSIRKFSNLRAQPPNTSYTKIRPPQCCQYGPSAPNLMPHDSRALYPTPNLQSTIDTLSAVISNQRQEIDNLKDLLSTRTIQLRTRTIQLREKDDGIAGLETQKGQLWFRVLYLEKQVRDKGRVALYWMKEAQQDRRHLEGLRTRGAR